MENKEILKKIKKHKKPILIISALLPVIFIIYVLIVNISAKNLEKYTEITFVNPNQAIIFWRSNKETLGYIKYGSKKYKRKETEIQTSSDPGEIHVVFLDRIPPDGIYFSKHLEGSNILIFPKIVHIQYKENDYEKEQ